MRQPLLLAATARSSAEPSPPVGTANRDLTPAQRAKFFLGSLLSSPTGKGFPMELLRTQMLMALEKKGLLAKVGKGSSNKSRARRPFADLFEKVAGRPARGAVGYLSIDRSIS